MIEHPDRLTVTHYERPGCIYAFMFMLCAGILDAMIDLLTLTYGKPPV